MRRTHGNVQMKDKDGREGSRVSRHKKFISCGAKYLFFLKTNPLNYDKLKPLTVYSSAFSRFNSSDSYISQHKTTEIMTLCGSKNRKTGDIKCPTLILKEENKTISCLAFVNNISK